MILFIVLGAGIAYEGYISTIYPVNKAVGLIIRAQSAQTPEQLAEYVELTKSSLPENGNPVWLFQTVRTDFKLIQSTLDDVQTRAELVESMDPHGSAYNAALIDMHRTADTLEANLLEALPYMYISFVNVIIASVWVVAIIAVFAAMRVVNSKTRARYEQPSKTV